MLHIDSSRQDLSYYALVCCKSSLPSWGQTPRTVARKLCRPSAWDRRPARLPLPSPGTCSAPGYVPRRMGSSPGPPSTRNRPSSSGPAPTVLRLGAPCEGAPQHPQSPERTQGVTRLGFHNCHEGGLREERWWGRGCPGWRLGAHPPHAPGGTAGGVTAAPGSRPSWQETSVPVSQGTAWPAARPLGGAWRRTQPPGHQAATRRSTGPAPNPSPTPTSWRSCPSLSWL